MKSVMRSGKSTYRVFFVILGIPLALSIAAVIRNPVATSLWGMLGITVVYGLFLVAWIGRFEIVYGDGRLRYRSLLGQAEVSVEEIRAATLEFGIRKFCDRFSSPARLVLDIASNSVTRVLVINAKVFDKDQLDALLDYLRANGVTVRPPGRK